ncbi:thioesterase-like superfamily-domain-containing protein [Aspergillus granulosus]|uniref:Thioesterase-like superfamily-domain-containing protein n=1 Tax=Aspergillus granulosus TaxID=176169 RepID=A0ABR4GTB9_9EURO
MRAVTAHFQDTLKLNQPHHMTIHAEFSRRAQIGPARLVIKDVKLGRRVSTVHVSLIQHEKEVILGYVTRVNFDIEWGIFINTGWELYPTPCGVDLAKLRDGQDDRWVGPYQGLMSHRHVRTFTPSRGQFITGMVDKWICWRRAETDTGLRFTNDTLGYVADVFHIEEKSTTFAFASLSLSLDMRKALPSEGLEWLFMRTTMKQFKNGRADAEIIIMDSLGDLVAVSNHATLVQLNQGHPGRDEAEQKAKI